MKRLLLCLLGLWGFAAASAQTVLPKQPSGTLFGNCTAVQNYPSMCTFGAFGVPYFIRFGVPVLYPSSGSMGNNGALTLTTAVPYTLSNAWIYLPSGAISTGSAAGVYYTKCTTTTACTVYNNTLSNSAPFSPGSTTAFVTTGPGAFTQTTGSAITVVTIPIPGGSLGADGSMRVRWYGLRPNNADAVTSSLTFGGSTFAIANVTNSNWYGIERTIQNQSSSSSQVVLDATTSATSDVGSGATAPSTFSIATASTQNLGFAVNLSTATDYFILLGAVIEEYHAD